MPIKRVHSDWLEAYKVLGIDKEPPLIYNEWVGISTIASVLQRRCWHTWEKKIYPNFYIVLVGPSGVRKGGALEPARRLLYDLSVNMCADSITREQMIARLTEVSDQDTDAETGELLVHSSLTIFSPELNVFLNDGDRKLFTDLTDLFDCRDEWSYETKNKGTYKITGAWLNLLGAITPELLRGVLTDVTIGGGLSSRIIFVCASRKANIDAFPFERSADDLALYQTLRDDLSAIRLCKGEFTIDESFKALYGDWYRETELNPPRMDIRMEPYLSRRSTHLRKTAMVMSAARSNEMVMRDCDFLKALAALERAEEYMHIAYSRVGNNELLLVIQRLLELLDYKKIVTIKEIANSTYMDATKEQLTQVIETVISMGKATYNVQNGEPVLIKKGEQNEQQ